MLLLTEVFTIILFFPSFRVFTPLFLFPFGSFRATIVSFILAIIYGSLVAFRLFNHFMNDGPKKFFQQINIRHKRPTIIDDPIYGEHCYYKVKDDVRIHYVDSGDIDRPIIFFLHGFPECWFSWRYQLQEFRKDYRTIAISLRGYGDSDKPSNLSAYSITTLIDDYYELIQHTTKSSRHKDQKIIMIGHDWGGLIAWYFTMLYPELIDKLIIMNASHPAIFIRHIQNDWQQFLQSWFIFFFQLPWLPELMFRCNDMKIFEKMFGPFIRDEQELDVYKYYFQTFLDCQCPINYYRAFIRGYGHHDLLKRLNQAKRSFESSLIDTTTLIIWSDQNAINITNTTATTDVQCMIPSLVRESAMLCRKSIIKFINNGSHWIHFEKPREINQIIRQFLSNALPPHEHVNDGGGGGKNNSGS